MNVLDALRGGLVVSVQARAGSVLDDAYVLAAIARAAQDAGAAGVRVQGVSNLQSTRQRVDVPIIGIIKREYAGYEPYITPTLQEVNEVLACGAEIVAFDATARQRPARAQVTDLIAAIHSGGALAMADCSTPDEGAAAHAAGADIVATTLCGYTKESAGQKLPAFDLVRALAGVAPFVICEGGIHQPAMAAKALQAGAHAVVVGTAITNTEWLVQQYAAGLNPQRSSRA
jgi:N-acylglucosamine-6-phosphate 2-epimerase